MGEYDVTTGYLFRQFPEDFVKLVAGDLVEEIKLADPVLKQTRQADATAYATIFSEEGIEIEVIIHIEFQTDADDTMPIRMAGYIGRLICIDDRYMLPWSICVRRKLMTREFINTRFQTSLQQDITC